MLSEVIDLFPESSNANEQLKKAQNQYNEEFNKNLDNLSNNVRAIHSSAMMTLKNSLESIYFTIKHETDVNRKKIEEFTGLFAHFQIACLEGFINRLIEVQHHISHSPDTNIFKAKTNLIKAYTSR